MTSPCPTRAARGNTQPWSTTNTSTDPSLSIWEAVSWKRRQPSVCSLPLLPPYLHTFIPPYFHTSILSYLHTPYMYFHTSIFPFFHNTIYSYLHTTHFHFSIFPYFHTSIPPYLHTSIPPTAHGTFVGTLRLEAHKPTQIPIDTTLSFGASTRTYTLRSVD